MGTRDAAGADATGHAPSAARGPRRAPAAGRARRARRPLDRRSVSQRGLERRTDLSPRSHREEEDEAGFDVEEQGGVLNVVLEEPAVKFVITPNSPVRQIWISALSTSFKLDWDVPSSTFVLPRTGEKLIPLVDRLIHENTHD